MRFSSATSTTQPASVRWQLWIIAVGFFMQTLDTTIVNTALPTMVLSLNENPLRMHSVVVAYVLTVAVRLPASGWMADKLPGRGRCHDGTGRSSDGNEDCAA